MADDSIETELLEDNEGDKELVQQFIEKYETLPELWNSKCEGYKNKTKRNRALDKLLVIYKKVNNNAKRENVRKKINSLRSNFRRELKKVVSSKRSGAATEEVYTPTTWTFYALHFLTSTETPATCYESSNKVSSDGANVEVQVNDGGNEQPSLHSKSSIDPVPPPRINKVRAVGPLAKQNELLHKACALLETTNTPQNNVAPIVLAWGEKILTLEPQQKIFAEKAINDILFEASLGSLHRNSVKINEDMKTVNPPSRSSCYYNNSATSSNSAAPVNSPSPIFHELQNSSSSATMIHNDQEETNNSLVMYFSEFQQ